MMTGSGGYAGDSLESPQRLRLRTIAMRQGFAAAVTNTGHDNRDEPLATFAVNRQKLLDYAFRSLHVTAEAGKKIATAYYGAEAFPLVLPGMLHRRATGADPRAAVS